MGTTNSCVAIMEGESPKLSPMPKAAEQRLLLLLLPTEGERLVGQIAKRQAITNSENTVFGIKRLIGRKYDSIEVQKDIKILPFKIEKAANGDVRINLKGKHYSPAEISSYVLSQYQEICRGISG